MLKIIGGIFLSLCLVTSSATILPVQNSALPVKVNKQVLCFPLQELINTLKREYNETSAMIGMYDKEMGSGLYVNTETGSYTIIEFRADIGCVLATGTVVWTSNTKPLKNA